MIVQNEVNPPLDSLAHYGVKGMRWGVHNAAPTTAAARDRQVAKLDSKINRKIDAQQVVIGAAYRNHYGAKIYKKRLKKDPNFRYDKLSKKDQAAYDRKISSKTKRNITAVGVVETAAILAGGNFMLKQIAKDPATLHGGQVALAIIAGQNAKMRIDQIRAVRTTDKHRELLAQRDALKKQKF